MAAEQDSGTGDGLLFEESPSGRMWTLCAAAALFFGGLFAVSLPPDSLKDVAFVTLFGLLAVGAGAMGALLFKTRNDATRYFADRVEVYRNGTLLHKLSYADVGRVAYGFDADGSGESLTFAPPAGGPRVTLTAFSTGAPAASPTAITPERLRALRDRLYDVVVDRMRRQVQAGGRTPWFATVEIAAGGLTVGGHLTPWHQVRVAPDDSTGRVVVAVAGMSLETSMVEDNVVAGLILLEQLQSAHRPAARAA